MLASSRSVVFAAVLLAGVLGGCTATGVSETGTGASGTGSTDTGASEDSGGGGFVTVSGTGRYLIGQDLPFGGYQLSGEPDEQPAGCTWQILDADGNASFENEGSYVFLTDIHEAETFVTDGCPDWEQFE